MEWKLFNSEEFLKCVKKLKLSKKDENFLLEKIGEWFYSENDYFVETHNNKKIVMNKSYALFDVHLPSQKSGKKSGKSGGYRLVMIYKLDAKRAWTGMIFERSELTKQNITQKREEHIEDVKVILDKEYRLK